VFGNFDYQAIADALPYLFGQGMVFTLTLTALSASGGLVLGTMLALARTGGGRVLATIVTGYVNLMRTLPLVLVIFWFYFLMPYVGQWVLQEPRPIKVGGFSSALLTFIMFEAAYFSEIVRGGIQAVARGQQSAGLALGMTGAQSMRYVVLPQVMRTMLPVLLTQTIVLFQDTSLVYVLSLTDFLGAASKIAQRDGRLVEMYCFAALIYFLICFLASQAVRRLQSRVAIIR
jgi:glutamate/aspartate transport system permease protein